MSLKYCYSIMYREIWFFETSSWGQYHCKKIKKLRSQVSALSQTCNIIAISVICLVNFVGYHEHYQSFWYEKLLMLALNWFLLCEYSNNSYFFITWKTFCYFCQFFRQIKYSVMLPGTHIWPHTGPTNCRLRLHLGLVIPKNVSIRVGHETR